MMLMPIPVEQMRIPRCASEDCFGDLRRVIRVSNDLRRVATHVMSGDAFAAQVLH
jgi:hypothetical protein